MISHTFGVPMPGSTKNSLESAEESEFGVVDPAGDLGRRVALPDAGFGVAPPPVLLAFCTSGSVSKSVLSSNSASNPSLRMPGVGLAPAVGGGTMGGRAGSSTGARS